MADESVLVGRRPLRRRRPARLDSVRIRTTAAATAVVAVALLVASVALVLLLRDRLFRDVQAAAEIRAEEIGPSSPPLPSCST